MPKVFRSPRTIAEEKNEPGKFDPEAQAYDGISGIPRGTTPSGKPRESDYRVTPPNPPDPDPLPGANLKR
jgi:hypothetical protein